VIVSAHEGASTWVNLFRSIDETTPYAVRSFHEYDDAVYRGARSTWQRMVLRARTFLLFPLRFLLCARRLARSADFLIVVTSPFFLPLLASKVAGGGRRAKIVVLLNDIYPEALVRAKIVRRGGAIERFFKASFARCLNRVDRVVFISEHHRRFVKEALGVSPNSVVIPVSAHSDPFIEDEPRLHAGPVDVLYCGTLGLMHDTTTFLGWLAGAGARQDGVRFSFFTSGASKTRFEQGIASIVRSGASKVAVAWGDALAESDWVGTMRRSQVGLVFQDVGTGDVVFPSKTVSILAAGQAVLAVAEIDSPLGRLVTSSDCGWVVEPRDVEAFDEAVRGLMSTDVLHAKRTNAFAVGHGRFGKAAVAAQWTALLDTLAHPSPDFDDQSGGHA